MRKTDCEVKTIDETDMNKFDNTLALFLCDGWDVIGTIRTVGLYSDDGVSYASHCVTLRRLKLANRQV